MSDEVNKNLVFATTKKQIGLTQTYDAFDMDLMLQINMVFGILFQLGVVYEPVTITAETTWSSFGFTPDVLGMVQEYVFLKTRKIFDPPQSGILMESMNNMISELEWRLNVARDPGYQKGEDKENDE